MMVYQTGSAGVGDGIPAGATVWGYRSGRWWYTTKGGSSVGEEKRPKRVKTVANTYDVAGWFEGKPIIRFGGTPVIVGDGNWQPADPTWSDVTAQAEPVPGEAHRLQTFRGSQHVLPPGFRWVKKTINEYVKEVTSDLPAGWVTFGFKVVPRTVLLIEKANDA